MTGVPVEFSIGACGRCSRWITEDNPQIGRSCKVCITEWLAEATVEPLDEMPIAYAQQGHPTWCAACGRETRGLDLCVKCDTTTSDPNGLVRR